MDGFLPVFYLLVVLKIPVLGAIWLVWWASKAPPVETAGEEGGGGSDPKRPLRPRPRGPHPAGSPLARRAGAPGRSRPRQREREHEAPTPARSR